MVVVFVSGSGNTLGVLLTLFFHSYGGNAVLTSEFITLDSDYPTVINLYHLNCILLFAVKKLLTFQIIVCFSRRE